MRVGVGGSSRYGSSRAYVYLGGSGGSGFTVAAESVDAGDVCGVSAGEALREDTGESL
jgi:hypothetical protein